MKRILAFCSMVPALLGLAACNSQPKAADPRVPHITYGEYEANPGLHDKYWPVCQQINASGTMTKPEDGRCRALSQFAATYFTLHHSVGSAAKK